MRRIFLLLLLLISLASCRWELEQLSSADAADIEAFYLYDHQNLSVMIGSAEIDNEKGEITATVKGGSDIRALKPWAKISLDATCYPKMGVWTDFTQPVEYTITAGNGVNKKTWKIIVKAQ